jgi:hypothetical protein
LTNIIGGYTGIIGNLFAGSTVANIFTDQQNDTAVASTAFVENEIARMGRKNVILNGDMRVAQRGVLFHLYSGDKQYTLDRWLVEVLGSAKSGSITQSFDILRSYCAETWGALVGTFTGSGDINIKQRVPGVMHFAGGKCVVSFAFYSSCDFTMNISLSQFLSAPVSGNPPQWYDTVSVLIQTGFHDYSVSFSPGSMVTSTQSMMYQDNCLELEFNLGGIGDITFWMTEVQMEKGMIPSAFDQRDDTEQCLRFYEVKNVDEKISCSGGTTGMSHWGHTNFAYKRKPPTVTATNMVYVHLQSNYTISHVDEGSYMWQVDDPIVNQSGNTVLEVSGTVILDSEINS